MQDSEDFGLCDLVAVSVLPGILDRMLADVTPSPGFSDWQRTVEGEAIKRAIRIGARFVEEAAAR